MEFLVNYMCWNYIAQYIAVHKYTQIVLYIYVQFSLHAVWYISTTSCCLRLKHFSPKSQNFCRGISPGKNHWSTGSLLFWICSSLPEPLMTFRLHQKFINAASMCLRWRFCLYLLCSLYVACALRCISNPVFRYKWFPCSGLHCISCGPYCSMCCFAFNVALHYVHLSDCLFYPHL